MDGNDKTPPSAAEVIAAAEKAIPGLTPSHRKLGCWCGRGIDFESGHEEGCVRAREFVALIEKWKEGRG